MSTFEIELAWAAIEMGLLVVGLAILLILDVILHPERY